MREKKLLLGFGIFLLLTLTIGIIGIFQIRSFTKTIQELGTIYLARERIILEMKINNALYAMEVRNYVFWRISQYLQAASLSSGNIDEVASRFKHYIDEYASLATSQKQKEWVKELRGSLRELENIGKGLISLLDNPSQNRDKINKLLMAFENRFYRTDDFLSENLSKSNLKDIEEQINLAGTKREASILILMISLISSVILGLGISYFVYNSLKKERERREMLVQRMVNLEEEERKNLSRQIHDQLGQDLGALKIYLELIEKETKLNPDTQEKLKRGREILNNLIEKSHNLSELLRPPELDELGLVESIEALVFQHQQFSDRKYTYQKPHQEIALSPEYSLALYRVVQESLTNISKHSKAKRVCVSLSQKGNTVYLEIVDDGIGFDYKQYLKRPRRRREDRLKLGLQGLQERIELLGGKFAIKTSPGKGTRIEVEVRC